MRRRLFIVERGKWDFVSDRPAARVRQIFQYLAELERLRNPPVLQIGQYSWTRRLDDLAALHLPEVQVGPGVGVEGLADSILTVRRPTGTGCPQPPEFLISRLKPGWENPEVPPDINSEPFEGDPERVRAQEWLAARSDWSQRIRVAGELFEELSELHLQLEREPEKGLS